MITQNMKEMVIELHEGSISKSKFNGMRSNSRNHGNLERSVFLACVYEIYKQEVKDGKKRET